MREFPVIALFVARRRCSGLLSRTLRSFEGVLRDGADLCSCICGAMAIARRSARGSVVEGVMAKTWLCRSFACRQAQKQQPKHGFGV